MPVHPTQIFLANPRALRVEYRLDDERLLLWWSPFAGESTDCSDRNFSSRDAHLDVFAEISVPGCGVDDFQHCDYDPYHTVLHFGPQTLHLALRPDLAAVLLWAAHPQAVDFKTGRHDPRLTATPHALTISRQEAHRNFEFTAAIGPGAGTFRHGPDHAPEFPRYARADLAAGQLLVIGAGIAGGSIGRDAARAAALDPQVHLGETDALLAPHEASGHVVSAAHPELAGLRGKVIRGLHSMIDDSAAYRASLKSIYSLIWIRDSGFSFAYQAAAGWPHKLGELSRLLLDNPLTVREPGLPPGRMFGQLVNRDLGKLEEDGLYYVIWTLFTQWTQTGIKPVLTGEDHALIDEALAWLDDVTWDESRGLYGGHFADETPTLAHRDHGWDHAIGKPSGDDDLVRFEGRPVSRSYDVYLNIILHSSHVMLAALRGEPALLAKAERLWPELEKLLRIRHDGIPVSGELVLADTGERVISPHWGPAGSCCVWGLSMPDFVPLGDWDEVRAATLDAIIDKPDMHFVNGICAAMAAVDPWVYPEGKLIDLHQRIAAETLRPGKYLPMGGAMPEKFNAPEGNLYHDIRPQGFAMGAWLAAWSSLGLRRLPHGLALRPTTAFDRIEAYPWRGRQLWFHFGPSGRSLALEIDGRVITGTLQIPESLLTGTRHEIRLVATSLPGSLWLRSSVQLDEVTPAEQPRYAFTCHGISRITFSEMPNAPDLRDSAGNPLAFRLTSCMGLSTIHFTHFGPATLA